MSLTERYRFLRAPLFLRGLCVEKSVMYLCPVADYNFSKAFMSEKKYHWYKVAEAPAEIIVNENNIAIIEVKGKKICLAKYQQQWFGFAFKCPHAGGILADGNIDVAGNIVCPLHRYKYSIRNGRNTSGEGYYLKTFPVETRDDGVFVGMEESGLFGWL